MRNRLFGFSKESEQLLANDSLGEARTLVHHDLINSVFRINAGLPQSAVCWVPLGATGAAFCPGLARFGKRNSFKPLINQACTVNSHAGGHRFETGRSH